MAPAKVEADSRRTSYCLEIAFLVARDVRGLTQSAEQTVVTSDLNAVARDKSRTSGRRYILFRDQSRDNVATSALRVSPDIPCHASR